jgi:hypothetical protein
MALTLETLSSACLPEAEQSSKRYVYAHLGIGGDLEKLRTKLSPKPPAELEQSVLLLDEEPAIVAHL